MSVLNDFNNVHTVTFTKRVDNLKIFYTNCDCLTPAKKREMEAIIYKDNPDIIAITEVLPKRSLYESNEVFL